MADPDPLANWQARIYEEGRWWRYEVRRPSGGGTISKGYRTHKGAKLALKACLDRHRASIRAAMAAATPPA